ncbi:MULTISPECIES: flagellar biosynthetic protein FliO [unclassified Oceanispirochaeta]|uniref:FliO/MopB family protein n=1 Tax=unclassified Oceanispirochaeta TaxID=2635722 RepID=UPI000E08D07F|nr:MULTISPECIES: flagellar biosynthetic protein FliO [unclassified Oceanispirochaeta]MBF9016165.1 flagellar biosynthetic protein FliO [Oceanispirochaeta sp. M2]NPD72627.1 hypothetical protein [Oceanispirochaeta sp. M1]RDG31778.1 hypothetical protein DV872_11005 [Oceanispirochaeta sp. M1]
MGTPLLITAQESSQNTEFPQINEAELPLFPADTNTPDTDVPAVDGNIPPTVGLGDLLRVIIVLIAVIGLIYLLVYFLKKMSPMVEKDEERISLIATRHLKRDSSLHLIEVGNQIFLIGSGSSSVNIISEITDQETLDRFKLEQSETPVAAPGSFRSLFRKGLSLGSGKKVTDQSPDFLRSQRDRLKNLRDRE